MTVRIITTNVYPPIPVRQFDWSAVFDGYEPGCPIGYGITEQKAIDDLLVNYPPPCVDCNGRGGVVPGIECATCEGTGERCQGDVFDPITIIRRAS